MVPSTSRGIMHKTSQSEFDEKVDGFNRGHTEKDKDEVELEKLLFGDRRSFRDELNKYEHGVSAQRAGISEEIQRDGPEALSEQGLEGLNDADLFFLDSEPSLVDVLAPVHTVESNEDGLLSGGEGDDDSKAAWRDSDDERIIVSLASNPRLRKLRISETEDLINGKDLTQRLRRQFARLHPAPKWANPAAAQTQGRGKRRKFSKTSNSSEAPELEDDASDNSEELSTPPLAMLLKNAGNLSQSTVGNPGPRKKLQPEVIDIHRIKDVGSDQMSPITSLAFHPTHPLILTSGPSSTIALYHISPHSPNPHPLLTTLHLRSTSLVTSFFLPPQGDMIFFSGRRRYFHTWDLNNGKVEKVSRIIGQGELQKSMERFKLSPCGRWMGLVGSGRKGGGTVSILNTKTSQWIAEVRVEGKGGVADFVWWANGEGMLVVGKGGEAVEWSGLEKRVVASWVDEGAVGTTISVLGGKVEGSKNLGGDRWVAIGSSSGIVNVYDRRNWVDADRVPHRPRPVRAFDQLTTPTSHLGFSPDGQILYMASRWKRDALRLVHLPSCTVYKNWPTSSTPLGRINAAAWSPDSQLLAVSNEQGKVRMWELRS